MLNTNAKMFSFRLEIFIFGGLFYVHYYRLLSAGDCCRSSCGDWTVLQPPFVYDFPSSSTVPEKSSRIQCEQWGMMCTHISKQKWETKPPQIFTERLWLGFIVGLGVAMVPLFVLEILENLSVFKNLFVFKKSFVFEKLLRIQKPFKRNENFIRNSLS